MFILMISKENIDIEIAKCNTLEECLAAIEKYLNDIKYKSYYKRYHYIHNDDILTIDYGSYEQFFNIIKIGNEGKECFAKEYNEYVSEHIEIDFNDSLENNLRKDNKEKSKIMNELTNRYEQLEAIEDDEMYQLLEEYINKLEGELMVLLNDQ